MEEMIGSVRYIANQTVPLMLTKEIISQVKKEAAELVRELMIRRNILSEK